MRCNESNAATVAGGARATPANARSRSAALRPPSFSPPRPHRAASAAAPPGLRPASPARARSGYPHRGARPRASLSSRGARAGRPQSGLAMDLDKCRYVVVEGPVGAGKTSLARQLAGYLDADTLLEAPDENPFLARFYEDMPRFALPTQLNFLFQRVDQLRGLSQLDLFKRATVSRLPARQGPAVRAPQPERRRVRLVREDLHAPAAASAAAGPRHLSAGAGDDADRARAQARRRL